ncbi:hypothetical protein C9374_002298 [Naegleria lovaniensis]|uniref:UDENN domain-containing protein n=1 Tax=Naegleria lovaniensis TaxID=51637 RepID=A0AA88GVP0_NAELO|nr:uncharacterized protein C9374_002298 [Naegleria lovaniensis]KAG2386554.1 hypothetical protein C9374_002298 [Naegleria lovaniensis]
MSRSRSVAVLPSTVQKQQPVGSTTMNTTVDHTTIPSESSSSNHSLSSPRSSSGGVSRLFECCFFLKYRENSVLTDLEFDYPKGYFHRFNVQQYISKLSVLNTYSNVILYRISNINLYCKYIPRVGILGFISRSQPYYSLYNQLILIVYSRMILLQQMGDPLMNNITPFLEYLYYFQPYPRFGEKFLIRFDTKNSILDSSHYLRRPAIDEFTSNGEINLLKFKPFITNNVDDFVILYKYLLLDKFILSSPTSSENTLSVPSTTTTCNTSSSLPPIVTAASNHPIKIVVYTRNSSSILEVMNFIYSILSLMYPFKYCGDIIPYCDENKILESIITSRHTSSIVGFLQKDFNMEKYHHVHHVILFNMDEGKIVSTHVKEHCNSFVSLPKENRMKSMLRNNIPKYNSNARILEFFVKCMANWFGNYRYHFRMNGTTLEFDYGQFLKDYDYFAEGSIAFYQAISNTLSFKIFLEERTKLVNDYATFQIQKIQFGPFEQECFKNNPRIFTNASTQVNILMGGAKSGETSSASSASNVKIQHHIPSTTNSNKSLSHTNGSSATTMTTTTSTTTTSSSGTSNTSSSTMHNSSSSSVSSTSSGFSLKQLFFKKTASGPPAVGSGVPNINSTTTTSTTNTSNLDSSFDEKSHAMERASFSDVEPMTSSFGTKIVGELQFSKENQLAVSFYCKESDAAKPKFSFTEFHQSVKPPKKYLPSSEDGKKVLSETSNGTGSTNSTNSKSELDLIMNDEYPSDGEEEEASSPVPNGLVEPTTDVDDINNVDNDDLPMPLSSRASTPADEFFN